MAILNTLMMTATGSGDTCEALEGTLWVWGIGNRILGTNDVLDKSVPTQIGSGTDWTNNCSAARNTYHMHHIKSDGTLWGWGMGEYGGVGDGTTTTRSSPVQIGSDTDWAQCSTHQMGAAAIRTDGTLWTWGENGSGECGLGDTTDRSSPTQVGSLTDWASVHCSDSHFKAALKTDGTLWSWGYNEYGQLGDNSTTSRSSPVQIGSATNWITFETGGYNTAGFMRAIASA